MSTNVKWVVCPHKPVLAYDPSCTVVQHRFDHNTDTTAKSHIFKSVTAQTVTIMRVGTEPVSVKVNIMPISDGSFDRQNGCTTMTKLAETGTVTVHVNKPVG